MEGSCLLKGGRRTGILSPLAARFKVCQVCFARVYRGFSILDLCTTRVRPVYDPCTTRVRPVYDLCTTRVRAVDGRGWRL
jgi:hypothetical protein